MKFLAIISLFLSFSANAEACLNLDGDYKISGETYRMRIAMNGCVGFTRELNLLDGNGNLLFYQSDYLIIDGTMHADQADENEKYKAEWNASGKLDLTLIQTLTDGTVHNDEALWSLDPQNNLFMEDLSTGQVGTGIRYLYVPPSAAVAGPFPIPTPNPVPTQTPPPAVAIINPMPTAAPTISPTPVPSPTPIPTPEPIVLGHTGVWAGVIVRNDESRVAANLEFVKTSALDHAELLYRMDAGGVSAIGGGLNTYDFPLIRGSNSRIPSPFASVLFMKLSEDDVFALGLIPAEVGAEYVMWMNTSTMTQTILMGAIFNWNSGTGTFGDHVADVAFEFTSAPTSSVKKGALNMGTDATFWGERKDYETSLIFYPDFKVGFSATNLQDYSSTYSSGGTWDASGAFSIFQGPMVKASLSQFGRCVLSGTVAGSTVAGDVQVNTTLAPIRVGDFKLTLSP
jgi:hypothetical protein